MDNVVAVPDTVTALDAAEAQVQLRAQKRAAARLAMDKARREYLADMEVERIEKARKLIEERKRGRPETIPDELMQHVMLLHADGESLRASCEAFGISRMALIRRVEEREDLRAELARARENCAHSKVDTAYWVARTEPDVERARLITELVRWEVAKVLPHMYGDRLAVQAPDGVVFSLNIGQVVEKKEETAK